MQIQQIIIKREKQFEKDDCILQELRDSRKHFSQLQAEHPSENQIKQLRLKQNSMEQYFKYKQKECYRIQQAIELKYTSLKIIRVHYEQQTDGVGNQRLPYSISAFHLFYLIHNNPLLSQVSLKGVLVQNFTQFLKQINAQSEVINEELNWIKSFHPSKQLSLSINAELQFSVEKRSKSQSNLDNLMIFCKLFKQVSDITAKITISNQIRKGIALFNIFDTLKQIKRINIDVTENSNTDFFIPSIPLVRSQLFGGLSLFTGIARLSLTGIKFRSQTSINNYLAIQQSLTILFQNNLVTHLTLNSCKSFPLLPKMKTLQSINLFRVSFRKRIGFLSELAKQNIGLRSLKCNYVKQKCKIEDQPLNRLQTILINNCQNFSLHNLSNTPLKIKYLNIYNSSLIVSSLPLIFTRLECLTLLKLRGIEFGHQLLCSIPSSHLENLQIWNNSIISNQGLTQVNKKWPQLRYLSILYCDNVTQKSICEFKRLIELRFKGVVGEKTIKEFQSRGTAMRMY